MTFGARLKEERQRLGLKLAAFAALVGTDTPKQSMYENDRRGLRADYLSRIAAAGVDIVYVLTGRRSEGEWLDEKAKAFLAACLELPIELQQAVMRLLEDLSRMAQNPGGKR